MRSRIAVTKSSFVLAPDGTYLELTSFGWTGQRYLVGIDMTEEEVVESFQSRLHLSPRMLVTRLEELRSIQPLSNEDFNKLIDSHLQSDGERDLEFDRVVISRRIQEAVV